MSKIRRALMTTGNRGDFVRATMDFEGISSFTSSDITYDGNGSYVGTNGLWDITIHQNDGSITGSAGGKSYDINSIPTPAVKLLLGVPISYINNYQFFYVRYEWELLQKDNFGSMYHGGPANATVRADHTTAGGQSGSQNGVVAPDASNTWDDAAKGNFSWFNTVNFMEVFHDTSSGNSFTRINGYDCMKIPRDGSGTQGAYVADTGTTDYLSFGQLYSVDAGDNGVSIQFYKIDIICYDGDDMTDLNTIAPYTAKVYTGSTEVSA